MNGEQGSQNPTTSARDMKPLASRIFAASLVLLLAAPAMALDHLVIKHNGSEKSVSGKIMVTAEDGGLMLLAANGEQWLVKPEDIVRRTSDEKPFVPLDAKAMGRDVLGRLPEGFAVHTTAHYVICYNTSKTYARWCGSLLERLYRSFHGYWTRRKIELHEPQFPLVVVICSDAATYRDVAHGELGEALGAIIGYYNLQTNRVTMQDLTGIETLQKLRGREVTTKAITRTLSRPEAQRMVATVIHEATHQIAYNCGLHERFTDIPFWLAEGLAVYFETPDVRSSKGWSSIGKVNRGRLYQFRKYLRDRPADSLTTLIADDKRFRDTKLALDAYAEAWALTYYLMRREPEKYQAYLQMLAKKPRFVWDTPEQRIKEFKAAFGQDLKRLDADFLRATRKLR
jgi:hypothetical protein